MVETLTKQFINATINMYPQLNNEMQFILSEISRVKDYFIVKICK